MTVFKKAVGPAQGARANALSGGLFSTVADARIRLIIEGGKEVRRELVVTGRVYDDNIGGTRQATAVIRQRQNIGELIRALFDVRAVIGTVGKALISGFAITAVFGAMFAAVNLVRAVFITWAKDIVAVVSSLKEMELGLTALLASTTEFSANAGQNFSIAKRAARELRDELIALDPQTLGGLKELQTATQALLATGAIGLVDSANAAKELAGVASLLVNAVVLVTGRVNDQRQIFSEIKELMLGNVRSQNQVAQLIAGQVGDLDEWLEKVRVSGTLLQELRIVLSGINSASEDFLTTLTAIESSEENISTVIRERAFGGTVQDLLDKRREILVLTEDNLDAIVTTQRALTDIIFLWERIKLAISRVIVLIEIGLARAINGLRDNELIRKIILMLPLIDLLRVAFDLTKAKVDDASTAFNQFATKSLAPVTAITDKIKTLDTKMEQFAARVARLGGAGGGALSVTIFKMRNELIVIQRDVIDPLIKAREELLVQVRDPKSFGTNVRRQAFKDYTKIGDQISVLNSQMRELEQLTFRALGPKLEKLLQRTRKALLNTAKTARTAFIRNFNELAGKFAIIDKNMRAGEAVNDRIAKRVLKQIANVKDIMGSIRSINNVNLAGLQQSLTIEEKLAAARSDAFDSMHNILQSMQERGAAAEFIETMERNTTSRINEQTTALRKQLNLRQSFAVGRQLLRRFRLQKEGIILPGQEPTGIRDLIEERRRQREQLEGLQAGGGKPEDIITAQNQLAALNSELQGIFTSVNSVASVIKGAVGQAFVELLEKGGGVVQMFKNIKEAIGKVKESLAVGFSQAFANAIQGFIQGTSSFRSAVGSLIIAIGNMAIVLGTFSILSSFILPNPGAVVAGLKLIALGATAIALGTALGGSGANASVSSGTGGDGKPEVPTFSFNQAQVNVQQGAPQSDLTTAIDGLTNATNRLETMPAGVVVKQGNKENGGLLTSVSREASRGNQFIAQRDLARSLKGI